MLVRDTWKTLAQQDDMKGAIVEYIREKDWVTFVELQRALSSYFVVEGEHWVETCIHNVFLWGGLSEELSDSIVELQRSGVVHAHPASTLTYMVDGGMCSLPIPKRARKEGYKKPHWVPMCLRLVPFGK